MRAQTAADARCRATLSKASAVTLLTVTIAALMGTTTPLPRHGALQTPKEVAAATRLIARLPTC